ncbi:MAG TPA: tetratricopeptide repeat protein [Stellaceae bacterium]|nr:tetratricopeptide repeat protein [Stellaceae bacterium]
MVSKAMRRLVAAAVAIGLTACAQVPSQGATNSAPPPDKDTQAVPTESVYGSYLAGGLAQRDHAYGAAAAYLERALADDPDNVELLRRTFLLRLSEGSLPRTVELARRFSVVDPHNGLPALVLLIEQMKSGDGSGAAAAADRLPQDGLLRFSSPLVVAWTKAGLKEEKAAIAALDRYDRMRGFEQLKAFHLALIEDYLGNVNGALDAYKKLTAASDRLNWRTTDMAGRFLERHGRAQEAKALYERFIRENSDGADLAAPSIARIAAGKIPPPTVASATDGLAEAMFDIASVLNQSETEDLSLLYAQLTLDLSPKHALAQMLVGEIAESEGRLNEALEIDRRVDPQSPFSWSARLRVAEVLDELGRTDEAIAELKLMASERPQSPQALIELGDILRERSKFAEAADAYEGAVARINPIGREYWSLLYSRGIAFERSGQWPRAEADFQRALQLEPDQPMVLNYLGYSWIEKRQHMDEALQMIQRAVQQRPDDGYIIDSLGWAYYQLGKYPEATRYLEQAIELLPEDPTINDHLGDAYWRSGRHDEARYQWRRALQFKPEDEQEAKTISAKLDQGLGAVPAPNPRGG